MKKTTPLLLIIAFAAHLFSATLVERTSPKAITRTPHITSVTVEEKAVIITWEPVPHASGYNIYTAQAPHLPLSSKSKANKLLVTSGTRFVIFRTTTQDGSKIKIKGLPQYISITTVDSTPKKIIESTPSLEVNNNCFAGFSTMFDSVRIAAIIEGSPLKNDSILEAIHLDPVTIDSFITFMKTDGFALYADMKSRINPHTVGGCTPMSTILSKLLEKNGIASLRADGQFIAEFHSFVIVNIAGRYTVLDITADQFFPDVAPVLLPRSLCFIDPTTGTFAATGRPIYQIERLYHPIDITITNSNDAKLYREIMVDVGIGDPTID